MNTDTLRRFALDLAELSGEFIRPYFANPALTVETKSDASPVTVADRGAEEIMRARITREYPEHGIIGEEFGSDKPDAEWVWVLDPIDGTKSFLTGCPLFGTLIALLHHGKPVLGIIHQPILRQLMIGDGRSTLLNGRTVRVRSCDRLEQATVLVTDYLSPAVHQDGARFDAMIRKAKLVRTWGDCYGYLLLSGGWADAMMDPIMNPWDIAALVPIVEGAGGVITDWNGGPAYPANSTLAAGPDLHRVLLPMLAG